MSLIFIQTNLSYYFIKILLNHTFMEFEDFLKTLERTGMPFVDRGQFEQVSRELYDGIGGERLDEAQLDSYVKTFSVGMGWAFIRFLPLLQVAYVKAQLNPIPKVLEEIYNYDIFLFQRKELICQLDFNIDLPWYADSCNMSQNTVVCPYVKDALVNAHFPRFPVSASASAVHSVAARRLHHRYPELLCRKRYRTGRSYSELLRGILYFCAQVE